MLQKQIISMLYNVFYNVLTSESTARVYTQNFSLEHLPRQLLKVVLQPCKLRQIFVIKVTNANVTQATGESRSDCHEHVLKFIRTGEIKLLDKNFVYYFQVKCNFHLCVNSELIKEVSGISAFLCKLKVTFRERTQTLDWHIQKINLT